MGTRTLPQLLVVLAAAMVTATLTDRETAAQPPLSMKDSATLMAPTPHSLAKESGLIDQVIEPELVLHLDPTRSKIVRTKLPVHRVAITDPGVLEVNQFSPTEFEFIGQRSGDTTLSLWFTDPLGKEVLLRYMVRVGVNNEDQRRAELEYGVLQHRLNELFPNSQIQLIPVLNKLIVRGQARDSEEATQIMGVLSGQAVTQGGYTTFYNPLGETAGPVIPGAEDLPATTIINMLTVPGEHQVMLKVRIAELSRNALRALGLNFEVIETDWSVSNFLTGATNLTAILDNDEISLFLRAFNSRGYSKILAEPTLVTLSGRTATFLAGGEFPVPTAVGVGGIGAVSTSFRGFGTQLAFTPTVIDKDRIRLQVAPSFSSLNQNISVDNIPGLNTRAVLTTVDLREGQWLAIAGLIQDQQRAQRRSLPWIGDVPLVGAAFGDQDVNRDETELVVLVSPELVHPLEAEQVPLLLPGMEVTDPTDHDFYLHQQIEGHDGFGHRSTVWPRYKYELWKANVDAIHGAKQHFRTQADFNLQQQHYIVGDCGFSN